MTWAGIRTKRFRWYESHHILSQETTFSDLRSCPLASKHRLIFFYTYSLKKVASLHGHSDIVKLLLSDVRINPSSNDNFAIRKASGKGHADILEILLKGENSVKKPKNLAKKWKITKNLWNFAEISRPQSRPFRCEQRSFTSRLQSRSSRGEPSTTMTSSSLPNLKIAHISSAWSCFSNTKWRQILTAQKSQQTKDTPTS